MTKTLANGYSSESTQRELFYEYQHDRVWTVFENLCVLVLWTKVAPAFEGLTRIKKLGAQNYQLENFGCPIFQRRLQYTQIITINMC